MGHKEPVGLFQKSKSMIHCDQTQNRPKKKNKKVSLLNLLGVLSIKIFLVHSSIQQIFNKYLLNTKVPIANNKLQPHLNTEISRIK